MRHHLSQNKLESLLRNEDVAHLDAGTVEKLLKREHGIAEYAPEGIVQIDPRNGDRILYSPKRAARPHHVAGGGKAPLETDEDINRAPSFVSAGKTTGIIDRAGLSEGFTFINFNLYPMLYPDGKRRKQPPGRELEFPVSPDPLRAEGMHFLQWTSSYQDRDWHNMPLDDCAVVMERLAALERALLDGGNTTDARYISIIKNCGHPVGGSVAHGHQQIGFSDVMPRRTRDLVLFERRHGRVYSDYLMDANPREYTIRDYGEAVLLVPYFMRRPFDMQLVLKDPAPLWLHQLDSGRIRALAHGWQEGIRLMRACLAGLKKPVAFNITGNTGPGTGIFFDFLPYTQPMGGFEHLGLYVCQANIEDCVHFLKSELTPARQPVSRKTGPGP